MNKMILKEKASLYINVICMGNCIARLMPVIGLSSYFVLFRLVSIKIWYGKYMCSFLARIYHCLDLVSLVKN